MAGCIIQSLIEFKDVSWGETSEAICLITQTTERGTAAYQLMQRMDEFPVPLILSPNNHRIRSPS